MEREHMMKRHWLGCLCTQTPSTKRGYSTDISFILFGITEWSWLSSNYCEQSWPWFSLSRQEQTDAVQEITICFVFICFLKCVHITCDLQYVARKLPKCRTQISLAFGVKISLLHQEIKHKIILSARWSVILCCSYFWNANSRWGRREILRMFWNPCIHYRVRSNPPRNL